jgi:biotin operon repressor
MYATRNSLYDRSIEKTPEQIFVNSLRKEFELSPAESCGILELAKQCLFGSVPPSVGKIKFICASKLAKHGKRLGEQEKVEVTLGLDGGIEDLQVLRKSGAKALRQLKVLRLTEEAYDQGGILTQEDLGRILQVSDRTIRKDIKELVKDGNGIHTRGFDHDIGRSLSHKSRIVELYLQGDVYETIMRKSRHSAYSIKRYVMSFGRLLLLLDRGITEVSELRRVLGQSEKLTLEYLELYERYKQGDGWPKVYGELVDQLRALYPSKKKGGRYAG